MRRVIAVFISCMVAICFLWSGKAFAAADYSVMRVTLTSMQTPTSISVTVDGNYSIPENPQISLQKRPYQISVANGQMMLSDGTTSIPMGASFTIKRHEGANPNQLRISNTSYGGRNYLGDFEVRLIDNTYIQLINCIYLETYLYGVVPYEMSDSFPIEALKAQAIAARTYAVVHYPNIVDTTWGQVYKGYDAGCSHAIQAVNDTAKQVLRTTNGVLVGANYSASNGGQTELPSNAWLMGSDAVYNVMKDDPYDLQNPSSRVDTLVFPKVVNGTTLDTTMAGYLYTFLQNTLISPSNPLALNPAVYSTALGDITIKGVPSLVVNLPYRGIAASKRMTNIHITLLIDVKNISNPGVPIIESIEKPIDINIDNMKAILLSIPPLTTRLFSVNETSAAFKLIGRGWGHGVGMSQRGAQQMAIGGILFPEILDFYYPNTVKALIVANPPALTPAPTAILASAFVTRFYQLCLSRDPDPVGLNDWVTKLQSGEYMGGNIAYNFVFSNEFMSRNLSNEDFVTTMYKAFFNRAPDPVGYAGWVESLRNGMSRYSVLAGFVNSQEFKNFAVTFSIKPGNLILTDPADRYPQITAFVTRFYKFCLDRMPEPVGLNDWVEKLQTRQKTGADVSYGFVFSNEFKSRNLSNGDFVTIMYKAFLNRDPDPVGYNGWVSNLNTGKTRYNVLAGFVNSREFSELCKVYGISSGILR